MTTHAEEVPGAGKPLALTLLSETKAALTNEERYSIITSNLQEVIRGDIITRILPLRPLKIYWGTATTGRPHAAYFVPAIKVAQFLQVGCKVKILLADLHGFLDADKAPEGVLEFRAQYYERVIRALLRSVGVNIENLEFVRGSSYQLSNAFARDLLRLSKKVSIHDATKASSEIVKSMGEPVMADGIYPMMQLLDEEYLDADAEFGGIDQRKTFVLANDTMHKMNFKTRAHLMNPMVPGLAGGKMSSSDPKSKIDLLDDATTIQKKIAKAYCAPREVEGNGILAFIQHVLLPYSALQSAVRQPSISIVLPNHSAPTFFHTYTEVVSAYQADVLTPQIVKKIVEEGLIKLTAPIQRAFEEDKEWQSIAEKAYPILSNKSASRDAAKPSRRDGDQEAMASN
ncbi:Nucleotidylyl transferase [Glarea lozoyensis ATCC 20868]|uniref:Tyrosine--tRNA ligase n=2 Tax=Glarea lozoyensis TaxID=101852 RepID=S3CNZ2_GLAL2|nr:Nucleotidylyl transferase [Glarea lozoyensis ATCC 20868]EHL01932.1 putative Tyrosyl-tRNA synthetase, cytoplasmic [Glarea lozoyensis 74030]EPE28212.1 Nucleotidylyl transferase [Glarea lozoyensis ATCC 20868]